MKISIHKNLDESDSAADEAVVSVVKKDFRHSAWYGFAKKHSLALVILVAAVIIAGSTFYSQYTTSKRLAALEGIIKASAGSSSVAAAVKQVEPTKAPPADPMTIPLNDSMPMLGNPNAPVTVIEFADYQCPYCGKFFKNIYPDLKEKYIDTGKVRFIYQDFAFLGKESEDAAQAAKCAGDQGKFWEYHDYLYQHQDGENQGAFSIANLKKFAAALKLNKSKFDSCLDSEKYAKAVADQTAFGSSLQITGTPTTFVNGYRSTGSQPFAAFETKIKKELGE
jgi:protein-disulfide isomerase